MLMMRSHCYYGNSCAMLHTWNFMSEGLAAVTVRMFMVRLELNPWLSFFFKMHGKKCPAWSCIIPENIHTSPTDENFFPWTPPLWKFLVGLIHFFKCFSLRELPPPGNSNLFYRSRDVFWNCTLTNMLFQKISKSLLRRVTSEYGRILRWSKALTCLLRIKFSQWVP